MSVLIDKCSQFTHLTVLWVEPSIIWIVPVLVRFCLRSGRSRQTFVSCLPSNSGERVRKILLLGVDSFYKGSFGVM